MSALGVSVESLDDDATLDIDGYLVEDGNEQRRPSAGPSDQSLHDNRYGLPTGLIAHDDVEAMEFDPSADLGAAAASSSMDTSEPNAFDDGQSPNLLAFALRQQRQQQQHQDFIQASSDIPSALRTDHADLLGLNSQNSSSLTPLSALAIAAMPASIRALRGLALPPAPATNKRARKEKVNAYMREFRKRQKSASDVMTTAAASTDAGDGSNTGTNIQRDQKYLQAVERKRREQTRRRVAKHRQLKREGAFSSGDSVPLARELSASSTGGMQVVVADVADPVVATAMLMDPSSMEPSAADSALLPGTVVERRVLPLTLAEVPVAATAALAVKPSRISSPVAVPVPASIASSPAISDCLPLPSASAIAAVESLTGPAVMSTVATPAITCASPGTRAVIAAAIAPSLTPDMLSATVPLVANAVVLADSSFSSADTQCALTLASVHSGPLPARSLDVLSTASVATLAHSILQAAQARSPIVAREVVGAINIGVRALEDTSSFGSTALAATTLNPVQMQSLRPARVTHTATLAVGIPVPMPIAQAVDPRPVPAISIPATSPRFHASRALSPLSAINIYTTPLDPIRGFFPRTVSYPTAPKVVPVPVSPLARRAHAVLAHTVQDGPRSQ